MKLRELYQNLSYGEFANLTIGEEGAGTIPVQHQPKVLAYVNQALTKLYSRFVLSEKELSIHTEDEITLYPLHPKYALSNPEPAYRKYISDISGESFRGGVLKIKAVFTEDGERLPLNDPTADHSIFTPSFDTLQINHPATGRSYFVIYQANHPVLGLDDLETEIALPDTLVEALQAQVAHKVFAGMTGEDHSRRAQELLARYELICREVELRDLASDSMNEGNMKLQLRGWV